MNWKIGCMPNTYLRLKNDIRPLTAVYSYHPDTSTGYSLLWLLLLGCWGFPRGTRRSQGSGPEVDSTSGSISSFYKNSSQINKSIGPSEGSHDVVGWTAPGARQQKVKSKSLIYMYPVGIAGLRSTRWRSFGPLFLLPSSILTRALARSCWGRPLR